MLISVLTVFFVVWEPFKFKFLLYFVINSINRFEGITEKNLDMISNRWPGAGAFLAFLSIAALLCQIQQASDLGQRSPYAAYRPTRKPAYTWMQPHVMVQKPRDYWKYVAEGRVKGPFNYGGAPKPGESPVNAVTYGSSYANSGYKGAQYGLWARSIQLNASNFHQTVMQDEKNVWVVAFIDPKCANCARFVAQWDKLKDYETMR